MKKIHCWMCGSEIPVPDSASEVRCDSCGTRQSIPAAAPSVEGYAQSSLCCLDHRYCRGEDCDTSGWTDIAALAAGDDDVIGIRQDGTAVGEGYDQSKVTPSWSSMKIPGGN